MRRAYKNNNSRMKANKDISDNNKENANNKYKRYQHIKTKKSSNEYKIDNSRNIQSSGNILESIKENNFKKKNTNLEFKITDYNSENENEEYFEENNKKDRIQTPIKKVSNGDNNKKLGNTIDNNKRYFKRKLYRDSNELSKDEHKDNYENFQNKEDIKKPERVVNKMDNINSSYSKKIKKILLTKRKYNEIENSKIDFLRDNQNLKQSRENISKIKNNNNSIISLDDNDKLFSEVKNDLEISKKNNILKKAKENILFKIKKSTINDYKIVDEQLSKLNNDYKVLKKENDNLKNSKFLLNNDEYESLFNVINYLNNENKQLKKKINDGIISNKDNKYFSLLQIEKQNCLEEILNKNFINNKNNNKNLKNFKNNNKIKEDILFDNNKKLKKFKTSKIDNLKIKENYSIIKENQFTIYNQNNTLMDQILDINNKYFEDILNGSKLKMEYDNLNEQFNDLKEKYRALKDENNQYKKELNKAKKNKIMSNNKTDKDIFKNHVSVSIDFPLNNAFNEKRNINMEYLITTKSLHKNNSTLYMNSIIQSLIHVNELDIYFLDKYPKDFILFKRKNKNNSREGKISTIFYNIIKNAYEYVDDKDNNNCFNFNKFINLNYSNINSLYLEEFKKEIISNYPKLENFHSKNFILYLLQIMHEELNNYGDYSLKKQNLNQSNKIDIYKEFNNIYESSNYSIISQLFYGTYEYTIKCNLCKKRTFNYQKFEFISFNISSYDKKIFNIYNGFEDNEKAGLINGENKIFCNNCNKIYDAENYLKIKDAPSKLIINIEYSNEIRPSKIDFDEIIDITKYANSKIPLKYRIISVCTFLKDNFITYLWNKDIKKWYKLNDSSVLECKKKEIYSKNPYLLLYEKLE